MKETIDFLKYRELEVKLNKANSELEYLRNGFDRMNKFLDDRAYVIAKCFTACGLDTIDISNFFEGKCDIESHPDMKADPMDKVVILKIKFPKQR